MARAASTDGHNETSRYESSSCRPSCRPGVTPFVLRLCVQVLDWPAAACNCFSTGLQSVASKLPGCHRASHWHAAARTWTSKWRPRPATSWPAQAAPRVPRRTSDTSRQVTRLRKEHILIYMVPFKAECNTDMLTLAVQWYCPWKVCPRLRVRNQRLCIIFQIVLKIIYMRTYAYILI